MMEAVGVKPVLKKYEAGRKCPVDSRKPQPFVGTSWQVARDLFDQSPIQIRCQSHSKLVFVFLWRGEMLLFCYGDGLLNRNLYIKWCHYWMYFVFVIIKDAIMPLILTWEMVQKAQPPPSPLPQLSLPHLSLLAVFPTSQVVMSWLKTMSTWTGEFIKSLIKAIFVERKSNKSAVLPGAPCPSPIIANFSRKIAQLGNFANYEQILCLLKSFFTSSL